jgi:hypothetical protein
MQLVGDDDSAGPGRSSELREYRARFSSGQIQDIVRVDARRAQNVRYAVASFRWFEPRSFLFGDPDEPSDTSKDDVELGN